MSFSLINLVLAVIGVVVIYLRLHHFDIQRMRTAPVQWIYCVVGHSILGVGMVARAVAEYALLTSLRNVATMLTLSGIVMVLTRSRRSKMK